MNKQSTAQTSGGQAPHSSSRVTGVGTKDGVGAADHNQAFAGFRRYHFTIRQMLRLLRLRGDVLDGRTGLGSYSEDFGAASNADA